MRSGVVLLLLAMCLTPGVDAVAKILTGSLTPAQVAFFRFLGAGTVGLCLARLSGLPLSLPRGALWSHLAGTALLTGATLCLMAALSLVPLACAVAGFLISPIVSSLLGARFLGEQLGTGRLVGAGAAFLGAMAIAEPQAALSPGSLLAVLGGALLGVFLVMLRVIGQERRPPLTILAHQGLTAAAFLAIPALGTGLPPIGVTELGGIGAMSLLVAATHGLTVAAYARCEATRLAPILYLNLVAALVVGILLFGEVPDILAISGMIAIVSGGLLAQDVAPWRHLNRRKSQFELS